MHTVNAVNTITMDLINRVSPTVAIGSYIMVTPGDPDERVRNTFWALLASPSVRIVVYLLGENRDLLGPKMVTGIQLVFGEAVGDEGPYEWSVDLSVQIENL